MKKGVVVIGAGGHAKVCVELLRAGGESVACCVAGRDGPAECAGVPVLCGDEHIQRLWDDGYDTAFIALGSNSLRERLADTVLKQGFRLVNATSPAASVSPSVRLGVGVAIMAGAVVNAEAVIGDLAIINTGATIDHDCRIGRAVHIAPQCALAGCVTVGAGSLLGVGCKVVPEMSIGENTVVGAGSVVISNIPSMVTAVGVPARILNQKGNQLRTRMKRISVAQPKLAGNERKYVLDCLDTSWISSNGKYIGAFEESFAKFCGVKHAIATNNGTTALHLALVALGLQPGDEVLIPTVTYIATANAVRYCGATPVFVDVCANTMNIDPAAIEEKITSRTRGIIPVHLYGHPAEMNAVNEIALRHGLWVVEDAAEAHGAEVGGRRVGGLGTCATFSFFGNKIVTTGEGGMVTTDDDELAVKLRLYRGQGMDLTHRYWFQVVGYNYRMTNIQAAIGVAQMESIDQSLSERDTLARWYDDALSGLREKLVLPTQQSWAKQVYWMYTVFLREGGEQERDAVMRHLDACGIETRPVFYPMHVMPPYLEKSTYPVADLWAQRGINLPTHQDLTREDVQRIAEGLVAALA